jgi:acyl-CoA reductase-like NAD-dependent aldehyde dehydrogenase
MGRASGLAWEEPNRRGLGWRNLCAIGYAASFLVWFAEEGKRTCGNLIATPDPNQWVPVFKQPVGGCAAITPWNYSSVKLETVGSPRLVRAPDRSVGGH